MKVNFKTYLPDLLFVLGFIILAIAYCSPVLDNKEVLIGDGIQGLAMAKESKDFYDLNGVYPWWTNNMFGGMPTFMIAGDYLYGIFARLGYFLNPLPGYLPNFIFRLLLGGFIFFRVFFKNRWLAAAGAIGFAFASLAITSLEAGHIAKINALTFIPLILAGIICAYQDKKTLAILLFSIGLGFEINSNHIQITYYFFMATVLLVAVLMFYAAKENKLKGFILNLLFIGIAGLLAVGTQTSRLSSVYQFTKETMRGKTNLINYNENEPSKPAEGLDKDYAFEWSYGKLESLTFIIPHFSGGASNGTLPKDSKIAATLSKVGVPAQNIEQFKRSAPSYWGDQLFVGGPSYLGVTFVFLFIFGLLIVDRKYRWAFLSAAVLTLFISWGKNLSFFNYFLFDHFPLYNKFRSVNMAINVLQLFVVGLGMLSLKTIIDKDLRFSEIKKPLLISTAILGGISAVLFLMPSLFFDFHAAKDEQFINMLKGSFGESNTQIVNDVYNALLTDRETLLKNDAGRSLFFVILIAGAIFLFTKKKINAQIFGISVLLISMLDLIPVDKRYLNNEDFVSKRNTKGDLLFPKTAADELILQDKDPNFRVINTTKNFWNDASDSYYHKSIGGYNAAKLMRTQEFFENAIIKDGKFNFPVLNMLNTKYFIGANNGVPTAQLNPEAYGNAWFVDSVKFVGTDNEEMKEVANTINLKTVAFINSSFKDEIGTIVYNPSDSSTVKLLTYAPNELTYTVNSSTGGYVVFSEVYYRGNEDWISYLDDKEIKHERVNYLLRGMNVPRGEHKITFKFMPKMLSMGNKIDLASSITYILYLVGFIFFVNRNKKKESE